MATPDSSMSFTPPTNNKTQIIQDSTGARTFLAPCTKSSQEQASNNTQEELPNGPNQSTSKESSFIWKWTEAEDEILVKAIEEGKTMAEAMKAIPCRTEGALKARRRTLIDQKALNAPYSFPSRSSTSKSLQPFGGHTKWTIEEDELLLKLMRENVAYEDMPQHISGRSRSACYERFLSLSKDGDLELQSAVTPDPSEKSTTPGRAGQSWSQEQDERVVRLLEQRSPRLAVSHEFDSHTSAACQNRYNVLTRGRYSGKGSTDMLIDGENTDKDSLIEFGSQGRRTQNLAHVYTGSTGPERLRKRKLGSGSYNLQATFDAAFKQVDNDSGSSTSWEPDMDTPRETVERYKQSKQRSDKHRRLSTDRSRPSSAGPATRALVEAAGKRPGKQDAGHTANTVDTRSRDPPPRPVTMARRTGRQILSPPVDKAAESHSSAPKEQLIDGDEHDQELQERSARITALRAQVEEEKTELKAWLEKEEAMLLGKLSVYRAMRQ